jgi:hypothetical protein
MKTINEQVPASGTLPDNYQEVLSWKLTEKPMRVITMNILGVFLFVIFGWIFSWLAFNLGKLPSEGEIRITSLSMIGLALAGVLLTLGLHELTHGLAMRMFGASPKYGFIWKWLVLYATTPGYAYHRNSLVVISLVPLVCLSILAVLGMWLLQGTLWVALLGLCGALNASGAVGDMWITMIVLRYANIAYVIHERDGIQVFLPKPLDEKIRYPADGVHSDNLKIEDAQHQLVKERPGG